MSVPTRRTSTSAGTSPNAASATCGRCSSSRAPESFFQKSAAGVHDRAHRGLDVGLERLHAGRGDLPDHDVAVAVEHQPRQPGRTRRTPAVVARGAEPLAQRQRRARGAAPAVHGPRGCDASRDRMRAQISACGLTYSVAQEGIRAERSSATRAGREARERRAVGVDLIAEDPQMPGAQAAVLAALELSTRASDSVCRDVGCAIDRAWETGCGVYNPRRGDHG